MSAKSYVTRSSVIMYLLLVAIVFLLPVEFSSYRNTDSFAPVWYLITESGGIYGSLIILLAFTAYLYFHFRKKGKRMRYLAELIALIGLIELSTLAFSQFYAKELVREPRPSQLYFVEKGIIEDGGRLFFDMPMEEKQKYLRYRSNEKSAELADVYEPILASWTSETGFSFPSGHSQSSFFLGVMISFVIFRVTGQSNKLFALIPVAWAMLVSMSRVVIGVHYPWDVAAGAALGLISALFVITLRITSRAVTH